MKINGDFFNLALALCYTNCKSTHTLTQLIAQASGNVIVYKQYSCCNIEIPE
ncbi:hypothetical protein IMY05_001G0037600 [Salix suchowensis]|nr:hypothetical protein IMY05_001G0037400 [Salix suchowensis]KAG5252717.1 hypothetical protein IMY05_001G0037600 [Salix suchowensis]